MSEIVINFNEMISYDYKILIDQLKEVALRFNPLILILDKAEFLIEPNSMALNRNIEIGFTFTYKGQRMFVYDLLTPNRYKERFELNLEYIFTVLESRLHYLIMKTLNEGGLDE